MVLGTTIEPAFETDINLITCAKEASMFWTFLSVDRYCEYNEERFKEALKDWGFYGTSEIQPLWLSS
jgi:hypothetical protein